MVRMVREPRTRTYVERRVLSDLRSPIDSATGLPLQRTPRYAAASSTISERQRVRKSRRCSASET